MKSLLIMSLLPAYKCTGPYKVLHGSTGLITLGYLWSLTSTGGRGGSSMHVWSTLLIAQQFKEHSRFPVAIFNVFPGIPLTASKKTNLFYLLSARSQCNHSDLPCSKAHWRCSSSSLLLQGQHPAPHREDKGLQGASQIHQPCQRQQILKPSPSNTQLKLRMRESFLGLCPQLGVCPAWAALSVCLIPAK